jgi:hypothetical protein
MKKLLVLLLALLLALPSGFALADDDPPENNEEGSNFWRNLDARLSDLWDAAQERAEETAKVISEKATEIAGQAQEAMDQLSADAQSAAFQLLGQALQTWQDVVDAVEAGKEKAGELIDTAEVLAPFLWEGIKDTVSEGADTAAEYVRAQLQNLLDWFRKEEEKADDNQLQVIPRALYFDAFYFGMPLSEAKLLGMGPTLGSPVVDEVNGVQYWTARFSGSWDTALLVFDGLGKDAQLTEIIYTVVDGKGAVPVAEETKNSAETIDAVYNSISSWFSGEQAIILGDVLPLPIYSGVIPAGSTVSRVRMFLFADGKGYDMATHFVLTDENGAVNMVQYQYLDAAKLESLLEK